jgi:hypothetical protein
LSNKKSIRECDARAKKLIRLIFKRLDTEEKRTNEEAAHESKVSFILSFFSFISAERRQEGGQIRSGLKNAAILVVWLVRFTPQLFSFNSKRLTGCAIFGAFVIFRVKEERGEGS